MVAACSRTRGSAITRAAASGRYRAASAFDDAAAKQTRAATAAPAGERGRQTSAQNAANSRYQGEFTPVLAIEASEVGSRITLAASRACSASVRTWPEQAKQTNTAQQDAITAPVTAKPTAASRNGSLATASPISRGTSSS